MKSEAIYLCVTAHDIPLQAVLRLHASRSGEPVAVLEGERPWERVCSVNDAAAALGVRDGMTRAEVESWPEVKIFRRSMKQEEAAKSVLLTYLRRYTPSIEDQSTDTESVYVLDLAGTERLWGPPQQIARSIQTEAKTLKFSLIQGISSNFHVAICLAGDRTQPIVQAALGKERSHMACLSFRVLRLDDETNKTLSSWGLRTCADIAVIPTTDLIVRLGQPGKRLSELSRGEHPHLFQPQIIEPTMREFIEWETPIDEFSSVFFVINSIVERLLLLAKSQSQALRSITIEFSLDRQGPHQRTVAPSLPSDDRKLWLKLIQLDLLANPPLASVLAMSLTANPGHISQVQLGIFSVHLLETAQLDVTLARIKSLVGHARLGTAKLEDRYSEPAYSIGHFGVTPGRTSPQRAVIRGACRRMSPPLATKVCCSRNAISSFTHNQIIYSVLRSYGPWKSSGDWWSFHIWSTETWDVAGIATGEVVLVCRLVHDLRQDCWHLDALYD